MPGMLKAGMLIAVPRLLKAWPGLLTAMFGMSTVVAGRLLALVGGCRCWRRPAVGSCAWVWGVGKPARVSCAWAWGVDSRVGACLSVAARALCALTPRGQKQILGRATRSSSRHPSTGWQIRLRPAAGSRSGAHTGETFPPASSLLSWLGRGRITA